VLMHRRHVDAAEAERLLDAGGGRLDRALKQ
jgi:hypothetical protein